jgi:hypothetical protein
METHRSAGLRRHPVVPLTDLLDLMRFRNSVACVVPGRALSKEHGARSTEHGARREEHNRGVRSKDLGGIEDRAKLHRVFSFLERLVNRLKSLFAEGVRLKHVPDHKDHGFIRDAVCHQVDSR